jgi:ABC-type uncharacterized transport system permease subunit
MMNYIAFRFFSWAFTGPLRRPGGDAPVTQEIYPSAYLPQIFEGYRFHWGFFFGPAGGFYCVVDAVLKPPWALKSERWGPIPNAARMAASKSPGLLY